MSGDVVFDRKVGWLPTVVRESENLRLAFAGGADALHDPRPFSIPVEERHLAVLQSNLARHLILWSALNPLCHAAGIRGPLDEAAAVALLAPILLASPDDVDVFLQRTRWDRSTLIAHGADIKLLESGRIVESLGAATETTDWRRAQEYDADRRRALRGVTLSPVDAAILKFTGQYIHGSTIPQRRPDAVDPALLPDVLRVIGTAERASAGMSIARDPRRGKNGTDEQDWDRMAQTVETAVRNAHPDLADDAVGTVRFLMCSEASRRARDRPSDVEYADDPARDRRNS